MNDVFIHNIFEQDKQPEREKDRKTENYLLLFNNGHVCIFTPNHRAYIRLVLSHSQRKATCSCARTTEPSVLSAILVRSC